MVVRMTLHHKDFIAWQCHFEPRPTVECEKSPTIRERFFGAKHLRMTIMSFRARAIARRGIPGSLLFGILHFAYASFRMTFVCNFFPAAKKLPRKIARSLSGIPAFRFTRRRGLRNSLRSNSPRPFSSFSLAPGSPIKVGMPSLHEIGTCAVE